MRQKIDWDELNRVVDRLSDCILIHGEENSLSDEEIIEINKNISNVSLNVNKVNFIATLGKERYLQKLRIYTQKGNK